MRRARRIVVIDDDPALVRFVEAALRGPDFQVSSFVDARQALDGLGELAPDLILCDVCMPGMDGRTFFEAVRLSPALARVPFVFLSGLQSPAEVAGILDAGADDFLAKPLTLEHLGAKVRATLRLSERMSAAPPTRDVLRGALGPSGALPLLRFCEDSRLSGRLGVESGGVIWSADFEGGELLRATSEPASDDDPLDALLALREGSYRIEQHPLDVRALREIEVRLSGPREAPAAGPDETVARLPGGRLSRVEVRGVPVEVQTEAENRPFLTITTVVIRGGQVIRKTESGWQHPLQRREDQELARGQVDRQHDRAVAALRELAEPEAGPGGGEAGLLAWALAFVAEQARLQLGAVLAVSLLRRTLRQAVREHPALAAFRVAEDARVFLVEGHTSAAGAVVGAAAWIAAFLREAGALSERIGSLRLRQATRLMESELERCGFYRALEAAGVRL